MLIKARRHAREPNVLTDGHDSLNTPSTLFDLDRQRSLSIQLVPDRHDSTRGLPVSKQSGFTRSGGVFGESVVQADGIVLESRSVRVLVGQVYMGRG